MPWLSLKRRSLAARIYSTLLPLVLMGIAVAVITWGSLRDNATPLIQAQKVKELAVTSLSLLLTQDDASKTMILDPENATAGRRKIQAYDANQAVLKQIQGLSHSPAMISTLDQMREQDDKVLRDLDTLVLEAVGDGKLNAARRLYFGKYEPARARYEALVRKLVDLAALESDAAASRLKQANGRSLWNICGALGIGIVLVALPLIYLARMTNQRLNRTVSALIMGAEEANQSSAVLADSSHALSEGAASTASSLEETNASLTEMTAAIRSTKDHSVHAHQRSEKTVAHTDSAVAEVQQLSAAMSEMKIASASISKIIRVIDEIAFQTNILALNAAVEAARAGEAGLGFSVVADEVRRLAQRSAEAARDTAELIEKSVQKSQQGVAITARVSKSLGEIAVQTHEVNRLIAEISHSCQEQDRTIQHIADAMNLIESVTLRNAREAETTSQAASTLRSRSLSTNEVLKDLVALVVQQVESPVPASSRLR